MKEKHKELVKKLAEYISWCFYKRKEEFIVEDIIYSEQISIILSGLMSGVVNILVSCSMATDNELAIKEMDIYVRKLMASVPESTCEIEDNRKH